MVRPQNINRRKIERERGGRRKTSFSIFLFYFASLSFFGVLFYIIFFSPFVAISKIIVNGNNNNFEEIIIEEINRNISGKYLGIVQKNNIILISRGKLEKKIKEKFKQIRSVKIKRKFPSALEVRIKEREFKMIFCEKNNCFKLDEEGYFWEVAPEGENYSKLKLITEDEKDFFLGERILETEYINYIQEMKFFLEEDLKLEIENEFRTKTLVSRDVRIKTKEGWEIYYNTAIDLEKENNMLKVVLNNKIEKEKRTELEYVDLRIDNKVYYKFKGEAQNDTETEKDKDPK